MKQNVGRIDRMVRFILGVGILAWGIYNKNWWGFLGLALLASAATGWCGCYAACKMSTCCRKD